MSKLTDIIRREIDARAGGVQLTPAVVISVQADFLRADVKLIENGAIIKGMLNQSGNKLVVGQSVKIAYQTLPSAGWIAFTNGEADPIGGGGGGIQVESAAILSSATVEDFVITQEVMIDYSPATKVLYGAAPAFIICQENYMLMASNWGNTEKALAAANEQYFPDATHYTGWYVDNNNIVHRVEEYFEQYISQRTWSTSSKGERLIRRRRRIDYQYPNNNPAETPVFVSDNIGTFLPYPYEYITIKDIGNNTTALTNYTADMFMLSRTDAIVHKNTLNAALAAFFPDDVEYACNVNIDTGYYNNGWGWGGSLKDEISSTSATLIIFPFKNRAEQDFSMGVTQRVEPVEVSP